MNATPSFFTGGTVLTHGSGETVKTMVVQSTGRVLVQSSKLDQTTVTAFHPDGSLDTSFGLSGVMGMAEPGMQSADVAVLPDDSILLVANVTGGGVRVLKLDADGTQDPAFGNFGLGIYFGAFQATSVLIESGGGIVLTGVDSGNPAARWLGANGTLLNSGSIPANPTTSSGAGVLQADGKVVIFGSTVKHVSAYRFDAFASDPTYGPAPQTEAPTAVAVVVNDVVALPDGSTIGVGAIAYSIQGYASLFGITANGTTGPFSSFTPTPTLDTGYQIVRLADGGFLVVGTAGEDTPTSDLFVTKYSSNLLRDMTFGSGGALFMDLGGAEHGRSIHALPDGRFLVAGHGDGQEIILARYNIDGTFDATFNGASSLDNTPTFTEDDWPVVLDDSVSLYDAELFAANDYGGASLTLERAGGANREDVFSGDGDLSLVPSGSPSAGDVVLASVDVGDYTMLNGTLTITFGAGVTQTQVNDVASRIAYANTSNTPPASVDVLWTFSDGDLVSPQTTQGNTIVTIQAANDRPQVVLQRSVDIIGALEAPFIEYMPGDGDGRTLPFFADGLSVASAQDRVALGDFNGDGFLDIASIDFDTNALIVMQGDGCGCYDVVFTTTINQPGGLVVADFDGDGHQDIVVTSVTDGAVYALWGDGGSGFSAPASIASFTTNGAIATGQFGGGPLPDLIMQGGAGTWILTNLGGRTFLPSSSPFVVGQNYFIGDFDGDGQDDAGFHNVDRYGFIIGDGLGGWGLTFTTPSQPGAVFTDSAAGDFDGDGKDAFVLADGGNGVILVYNPYGGENTTITLAGVTAVSVADMDGDGDLDIVAATAETVDDYAAYHILLNDGTGQFTLDASPTETLANVNDIALGNVDPDVEEDNPVFRTAAEGQTIVLAPRLELVDPDSPDMIAAAVAITAGFEPGDVLAVDTTGTSIYAEYIPAFGTLILTGPGQPGPGLKAEFEQVLRTLTYTSGENPGAGGPARQIAIAVQDDGGDMNWGTGAIVLQIGAVNDAPTVAASNLATAEDQMLALSGIIFADVDSDPAVDVLSVVLSVTSGALAAVSGGGVTVDTSPGPLLITLAGTLNDLNAFVAGGGVTYTPAANANGTVQLAIGLGDTGSPGDSTALVGGALVDIVISPANDAPNVANAIADQASPEDQPWTFQVPANTFSDVDGDTLTWAATLANGNALPSWLTFTAATRTFSGMPPLNFNGTTSLMVRASDASTSATDVFDLVISLVNDAPTVANPIADQGSPEDQPWTFQVPADAFNDVDGSTLTYAATLANGNALPSWLTFTAASRTFSGTPSANFNGTISLMVRASDASTSATDVFDLVISLVNDAPTVANPIADQASPEDQPWTFQVPANAFADIDGDTLTYAATLANGNPLPSWLTFTAATRSFSGTPPANFNGTISLMVRASDASTSATDVFDLVIGPVNDAPVAAPDLGGLFVGGTASGYVLGNDTDIDGPPLSVAQAAAGAGALQAVGPGGLALVGAYGTLTIQPNGTYSYTATAVGLLAGQIVYDAFSYVASDGSLAAAVTTLTFAVGGSGTGTAGNDLMKAWDGGAVVDGLGGNDTLAGGIASDTLNGGDGSDVLDGGPGADAINGGTGNDTAGYVYAPSAVIVNLSMQNGAQNTGGGGIDTLTGIENLAGSAFDDILVGDAGNNILAGGVGNDTLEGGGGDDALLGGEGTDAASYMYATAGVTVSLAIQDAYQDTIGAGIDYLSGIEHLVGSAHADVLTGNAASNTIAGGAGADALRGGGRGDVLIGGSGADYFILSALSDSTALEPDIVTDFEAGLDKLDFRFIRTSAADSVSIAAVGGYTMVTFDAGGNGTPDARVLLAGAPAVTIADILMTNPASNAPPPTDAGYLLG